tara:strand:+ start:187 stop:465 length:279 start_codon:yes stop_codon:yes gene_type:complete
MKVGPIPMSDLYDNSESEFKNIIIMAKRARDIIETRFEANKVEEDIEDSDQLEQLQVDDTIDYDEPKAIIVALNEFKNNEIDWKDLNSEENE